MIRLESLFHFHIFHLNYVLLQLNEIFLTLVYKSCFHNLHLYELNYHIYFPNFYQHQEHCLLH